MCIIFERSNNTKRKSQKEREKAESQKERGGGGERFSYFLLLVTFAINWFNQATITNDRLVSFNRLSLRVCVLGMVSAWKGSRHCGKSNEK